MFCIIVPNFMEIGHIIAEILQFFRTLSHLDSHRWPSTLPLYQLHPGFALYKVPFMLALLHFG